MTKTINLLAAPIVSIKGKGKAQREAAFIAIAPLSFVEDKSRGDSIANLNVALGLSPTEAELAAAQREWSIGRAAHRMPAGEFPVKDMAAIDKLEFVRKLFLAYAAPAKDGTKARKLRAGQLGRRSPMQHRVIRNAEEAWSLIKAELGLGTAKTQAERNADKAKRAPQMAGSSTPAAPAHSELVKPAAPVTASEACDTLLQMALSCSQFAKKNAKLLPAELGKLAEKYRRDVSDAIIADKEARAAADAKAAELAK